jgi:hypothetical protein
MAKGEDSIRFSAILPWFVSLLLVAALIFVMVRDRGGKTGIFGGTIRKNEILSAMRLNLLRAAEAEKSAVLAVSDEESQKFADQARVAAAGVNEARTELAPLLDPDSSAQESARIAEFDRCWTEFEKLDQFILDLAVQNTNLHAMKLAVTRGSEAIQHLEGDLTRLVDIGLRDGGNLQTVRLSYQALVAGIKIHDLYALHIGEETDEQMDAIERDIRAHEEILKDSLNELAGLVKGNEQAILKDAGVARDELAQVTNEIIDLSRKNTNIKSLELSLGKKRLITAQCDEVLSNLQELIRGRSAKATR